MSIDAFALLKLTPATRAREEIQELDELFRGDDYAVVSLDGRYDDVERRPRKFAIDVAESYRRVLLAHDDPRGVLVVHDAGGWDGGSYAAIVAAYDGDGEHALWLPNLAGQITTASKIATRLTPKDVPLLPLRGAIGLRFANLPPLRALSELSLKKTPSAVAQYQFDVLLEPVEVIDMYEPEMKRLGLRCKRGVLVEQGMAQVIGQSKTASAYVHAVRAKVAEGCQVTITWIAK